VEDGLVIKISLVVEILLVFEVFLTVGGLLVERVVQVVLNVVVVLV